MIGRLTPAGEFTGYTIPTPGSGPYGIVTGPDGALWFAEAWGNRIGRLTTAGVFTEYPVPTANSAPAGIAVGPDGALWFPELNGNRIGRVAITTGTMTEYPVPTASSAPDWIAAGPDGALWFTELSGGNIGRITTGGTVTEYAIPTPNSQPEGIAASGHRGPGAGFMEQCEQGVEMNPETPEKDIDRVFREGTALDEAMTRAYRRAVRQHRQNGVPMVFWENGKIVEVPADQLPDFSVD